METAEQVQVLTAVTEAGRDTHLITALRSAPGRFAVVRRCVDLADLLGAVGAGLGQVALVSSGLRRLDRDAVDAMRRARVGVIGVVSAGDAAGRERLAALGVDHCIPVDAEPSELAAAVLDAITAAQSSAPGDGRGSHRVVPDGGRSAFHPEIRQRSAEDDADPLEFVERGGQRGQLIAVWGPYGAPGRTTIATNVAMELAMLGTSTMLVDADTYGASIAETLGLLDDAPGLAGAARMANQGQLDAIALARYARKVTPELHVLTGVTRPARWTELRPAALEAVWSQTRSVATATVVDCGFCLEEDEAMVFDTDAPRRNGATVTTLASADVVLAVGAADPISLGRFVRGLADLREIVSDLSATHVVVNKVRRSVAGAGPEKQIGAALERFVGVQPAAFVPDDPAALDLALVSGRTLAEIAPRSAARHAILALSRRLAGLQPPPPRRRPTLLPTRRS
ncbi:AAA family ATPase [Phytoactinopolyspora halotolerans]|uniref:Chromosome partitioning protein n=1 Tax=Phytoactinopolyspora halotolerans TaxID=1981512 RepID=A0A6L9SEG9_9ACTN|nr:P-loop NTPase [Phytoactinopolyspora halotolerans]NEE02460.1 chromosome partitioning protein [Phytoactinopolyspora halotolerans]